MNTLVILDISDPQVQIHLYPVDESIEVNESFIRDTLNFDIDYCQWVVCNGLAIIPHDRLCK